MRDAGRNTADAGQPPEQTAQRDSGQSAGNVAGSSAMQTPAVTKPDSVSQCMPGTYEGTFEGPVTFAVGSINSVSGSMRAELALAPSGDALEIRNGMMMGKDNAGIGMSARWAGNLNCGTKQLENGRHEAGAWDNGSTFTGTLEGTYSINPYTLAGTWKVQSQQIPLAGGNGTWHVTLLGNAGP